jgi:hypothetical protein
MYQMDNRDQARIMNRESEQLLVGQSNRLPDSFPSASVLINLVR